MNTVFLVLILVVVAAQFALVLVLPKKASSGSQDQAIRKFDEYEKRIDRHEVILREEFSRNREEVAKSAAIARNELTETFTKFFLLLDQRLTAIQDAVNVSGRQSREELALSLKSFEGKGDAMRDAVEKRTSEIWQLLGAVKTEFGKFGEVLEKTKQKLDAASKEIDSAGARSRMIAKQQRDVQVLPAGQAAKLLEEPASTDGQG